MITYENLQDAQIDCNGGIPECFRGTRLVVMEDKLLGFWRSIGARKLPDVVSAI